MPVSDPVRRREIARAYYHRNRDVCLEKCTAYNKTHRTEINARRRGKRQPEHLRNTYGLSVEQFDALIASQNNGCAICGGAFGETKRTRPCVDHCHRTGKVRGLLCIACNCMLGFLEHPKRQACEDYLKRTT